MIFYWANFPQVLCVEVEDDAIYLLTLNQQGQKQITKLYEMEDNVKIQTLLKKNLYQEAQKVADQARFPPEIIAEISKEHADNLYNKKAYDEALVEFKKTIGYLNPSYVIQRYIDVPQLKNLIQYLEELIRTPAQSHHMLADYEKDYTALLLNCYVKTKEHAKIRDLIAKENTSKKTIFDVETAIEVCRQQEETVVYAEELARKSEKWRLLV